MLLILIFKNNKNYNIVLLLWSLKLADLIDENFPKFTDILAKLRTFYPYTDVEKIDSNYNLTPI
jgi:hypothetical protein